jgi:FkbM family methyltransferase
MEQAMDTKPKTVKVGCVTATVNGKELSAKFPDTGNAERHIAAILGGRDYPKLRLSEYSPSTIIDVGANVGATALYFNAIYPDAMIHAYEPARENFEFLRANLQATVNVRVYPIGLSDAQQASKLYHGNFQCLQHSLFPSVEVTDDFEEVHLERASIALQPILTLHTLLKIDTEGCELKILQELQTYFDKIDLIYFEFHSERDRVEIEHLLSDDFALWYGKVISLHRGTLGYVSKSLIAEHPELNRWEIRST